MLNPLLTEDREPTAASPSPVLALDAVREPPPAAPPATSPARHEAGLSQELAGTMSPVSASSSPPVSAEQKPTPTTPMASAGLESRSQEAKLLQELEQDRQRAQFAQLVTRRGALREGPGIA